MDELQQFKATYINECVELLEVMEQELLELDENATSEQLNAIFRCAHSIKGGAGAFSFTEIVDFTHVLEAVLDAMREGKVSVTQEITDILLKSADVLVKMVDAVNTGTPIPPGFGDDLVQALEAAASEAGFSAPGGASKPKENAPSASDSGSEITLFKVTFVPHGDIFATGNEPLLLMKELQTLGEMDVKLHDEHIPVFNDIDEERCYASWVIELETEKNEDAIKEVFEFVEEHCKLQIDRIGGFTKPGSAPPVETATQPSPKAETPTTATPKTPAPTTAPEAAERSTATVSSIRVDVDKVDRLVNMVGEIVIVQSMLSSQTSDLPVERYSTLLGGINELSQHTRELQEAVMAVRMQPVKSVFSRMPRLVRDLGKQLGKDIIIEMHGENTEIDKTVIEQLSDPLTHMIRNSIDHGIEKPEDRLTKGKPAQGKIKLAADNSGGRIEISIKDDGNGINREKVLSKAIERGLVQPDAKPTDTEIDQLIFMPGFSTADAVSNISGRGVGMDVVKRNIEGLGGRIYLHNYPNQGSEIVVSLPLTLAILDSMIVKVGREHYVIPINNIIETLRPRAQDIRKVAGANDLINVRGEYISILYLHRLLGIEHAVHDLTKALVILVENDRQKFGLVVDELIGQQQVVIKSLEENSDPIEGVSGATILGDGKVSLILDIAKLQNLCNIPSKEEIAEALAKHSEEAPVETISNNKAASSKNEADSSEATPSEELENTTD